MKSAARRFRAIGLGVLVLCASLAPRVAQADLLEALNAARARGCEGRPGAPALRANATLDAAARRLSRGEKLETALREAGYRATESASVQVSSTRGDRAIAALLAERFCAHLANPLLREIGIVRSGAKAWIVLAAPLSAPPPSESAAVARRILELVNEARSSARRCGHRSFPAAPPLRYSPPLERAAHWHAEDMATHGYHDHRGRDGSTPADRVTRAGHAWRVVGENIAAGPLTAEEVVQGWLASPHHCANIMDPRFSEMGVAYAFNPESRFGIYWAQVFAAPSG